MRYVYVCTADYVEPTLVSITSIVTKCQGNTFYICLPKNEYSKLTEDLREKAKKVSQSIQFVEISEYSKSCKEFFRINASFVDRFSDMPIYKTYLPDIFTEIGIDSAIYLDCDTIMLNYDPSIENILDCGLGLCSYPRYKYSNFHRPRVNPGIIYLNLNMVDRQKWAETRQYVFEHWTEFESDHLDTEFYSKFYFEQGYEPLDNRYNSLPCYKGHEYVVFMHFATIFPWNTPDYLNKEFWMAEYKKYIGLTNEE